MKYKILFLALTLCLIAPGASSAQSTFDYLWDNTFHYTTLFESLDGYAVTGNVEVDGSQLLLVADSKNPAEVIKTPLWHGVITFSQRSRFRTSIAMADATKSIVYYSVGNRKEGYGFKIVDGALFGYASDGKNEKTVALGFVKPGEVYNLEARFRPESMAVFYVNRVLKGRITSSLPRASKVPNRNFIYIHVSTADAVKKSFQTSYFEYLQMRNESN